MKIIVAESAGFCWGVRRAMEKTLELSEKERDNSILTLGPLIHNKQAVNFLSSRGVKEAQLNDNLQDGTVIIRAHGTTPEMLDDLKKRGVRVLNTTCPRVGKVQALIKGHLAKGYTIIIVGDIGHAEVKSLMGYAQGNASLIQTSDQAGKLPDFDKAIVVSQTTFDQKTFDDIANVLREKVKDLKVFCTICDSTAKRQEEAKELASKVDCMIIVGGHHSANTTRLAEISRRFCDNVYHIETDAELTDIDVHSFRTIGVSAGASTPNWVINSVVQALRFKDRENAIAFRVFGWMFYCGIFRSLAALFLCAGIQITFSLPQSWKFPLIAFLYLFSVTNLNGIVSGDTLIFSDPTRFHFIRSRQRYLSILSIFSIFALLGLGLTLSLLGLGLLLLAVILGILYRIRIGIGRRPFRIFDIPGSKNLLHGLAWSIVIAAIPILAHHIHSPVSLILGPGLVFLIVFSGTVLFDFKDYQGDRFAGKETLPILLGRHRAAQIVLWSMVTFALFLCGLAFTSGRIEPAIVLTVTSIYSLIVFIHYSSKGTIPSDGQFEIVVDGIALAPLLVSLVLLIFAKTP